MLVYIHHRARHEAPSLGSFREIANFEHGRRGRDSAKQLETIARHRLAASRDPCRNPADLAYLMGALASHPIVGLCPRARRATVSCPEWSVSCQTAVWYTSPIVGRNCGVPLGFDSDNRASSI